MFKTALPALFLASAMAAFGSASAGVSSCQADLLSNYSTNYAPPSIGCSIGILDYSNFTYSALSNAPAANAIEVTPTAQGFGFTQANGNPFAANGDIVKFAIYYNIYIDPAPVIAGADANLDPPAGNVSITQYFCNDSVLYPNTTSCFPPTSTAYSLTVTTASPTASITFATPATVYQTVGLIFTLDGTTAPATFDGLDANTTVIGAAPEPASVALVGLFLAGGALTFRRKRKA